MTDNAESLSGWMRRCADWLGDVPPTKALKIAADRVDELTADKAALEQRVEELGKLKTTVAEAHKEYSASGDFIMPMMKIASALAEEKGEEPWAIKQLKLK